MDVLIVYPKSVRWGEKARPEGTETGVSRRVSGKQTAVRKPEVGG